MTYSYTKCGVVTYTYIQDVLSKEVRPILRSDEEKELVWRHPEDEQ